jgi:hypothetical protein
MARGRPRPELANEHLVDQVTKRAMELRLKSKSLEATADELNAEFPGLDISRATVTRWINKKLKPEVDETVDEYRLQMLSRIEAAREAVWPRVLRGDEKAGAYYLRLEQKEADLRGLDKPVQVEVSATPADNELEVQRMIREYKERRAREDKVIQGEVVGRSEG